VSLPCLRAVAGGVELALYVQPRASRNKVVALHGEELKVALTAPPVDGAANKACQAFLAKLCGQSKSSLRIVAGESSRHKRWLLEGAALNEINALLEGLLKA
jgi:uncharacterized protein (TIGR00251 family)